ncbi:hypothetical protein LCY76_04335 [Fictibacillus sp. KIGAM418]|uniref:Uncharacterized protein n=1 Tax=Fictibacillus marinisediminis TaxID=2878389 RepID=A0A9X1X8C2_9BACL|nr:hypothetical protein [Fictibacillus marinisediminis]MCK6255831.1 hypothetical protein [Fictibacillus marinisediminis]
MYEHMSNIQPGYHMPKDNKAYQVSPSHKQHWMHLCKQYAGANCEIEMADGKIYHGKIHSHDNDNIYLIMPMQHRDEASERFFPGFGFGGFPGFGFGGFGFNPFFVGPFFPGFGLFGFPFFGFRGFRRFWW